MVEGNNGESIILMEFVLCAFKGDRRVVCTLEQQNDGFRLTYEAEPAKDLVWPKFEGLQRVNELWRSTCCELFIGEADSNEYIEINICPSGRWNCFRFDSYREGMCEAVWQPRDIRSGPGWLEANWPHELDPVCHIGPAAVLADRQNHMDYLALRHGDRPDFHDRCQHVLVQRHDL